MEADSTTHDVDSIETLSEVANPRFPFNVLPGNMLFYMEHIHNKGQGFELCLVQWLQGFGLIPKTMQCPSNLNNCKMSCKRARVVDRVQWQCEGCGNRVPVRANTFFMKLPCSIQQILQIVLAWCEDADWQVAAQYFGVRDTVAYAIYGRLDEYAVAEVASVRLGGEDSVVLSEMYPDCLNVRSPDTTTQKHTHQILMLADTKHIPTRYRLYVVRNGLGRERYTNVPRKDCIKALSTEVTNAIHTMTDPRSLLLRGNHVPTHIGTPVIEVAQNADNEMQQFLSGNIWSQAINLCLASRDICAKTNADNWLVCEYPVQKYLNVSLFRIQQGDGFYQRMLSIIAATTYVY